MMDRYRETASTWNKLAELYQDKFMDLDLYNESYDFVCSSLTSSQNKILEIGCGPGNITKYLLSKRPDFKVTGVDIAPNMIELARRNNPSAEFIVMDIRHIGEIKKRFDAIVCGFCIPYLSKADVDKLISDCTNMLADDGLLYFSFVDGDYIQSDYQTSSHGDRVYFYYHRLDMVEQLFREYGFEDPKKIMVNYRKADESIELHMILIARKIIT